ncbi:MAG: CpsB/CapC family capsule biosynthesis tyrosine phosphatase [Bacillota bacterium]|nr:CpsB/CapC family capsule biosynthesis tyrosine phosphatase [Bacillota bacterium]
MLDFHTHVLPGIDDGAPNIEISLSMLAVAQKQQVNTILATPHFCFAKESLKKFIKKRDDAFENLMMEVNNKKICVPNIILGAEVYMTRGFSEEEELGQLCIQGTNCILVEMPMGEWSAWMYEEIYKICNRDFIPVMAHLERYAETETQMKKVEHLLNMEICIQINASNIMRFKYKKAIRKFIKSGKVVVLGSDAHDDRIRKSEMDKAIRRLGICYGKETVEKIDDNARILIENKLLY